MIRTTKQVLFPELSYQICGLCFNVHNQLGRFRSEKSYADALEMELKNAKVQYDREKALSPSFEGESQRRNIPDFIIDGKIVLDAKAKRLITTEDYYQMQRYLEVSKKELGLIINFRQNVLTPRRILAPIRNIRIHS